MGHKVRVVIKRQPMGFRELIFATAYVGTRKAGTLQGSVGEPFERMPRYHFVIEDIEVVPEFQRLGVATRMVRAAMDEVGVDDVMSIMPSDEGLAFLLGFRKHLQKGF